MIGLDLGKADNCGEYTIFPDSGLSEAELLVIETIKKNIKAKFLKSLERKYSWEEESL